MSEYLWTGRVKGFKCGTDVKYVWGYICVYPCNHMSVFMSIVTFCAKWYTYFMHFILTNWYNVGVKNPRVICLVRGFIGVLGSTLIYQTE